MQSHVSTTYRREHADLFRFAYRMTQNREEAEDMVQEAFLRMARDGARMLDGEAARRWLFVVVRNLCLEHFRKAGRWPRANGAGILEDQAGPETAEEHGSDRERAEWVRKAIAALAPPWREVILLREYHGMAYAEMAEVLGCSEGTVKSRLARARGALKECLEPAWEEYR